MSASAFRTMGLRLSGPAALCAFNPFSLLRTHSLCDVDWRHLWGLIWGSIWFDEICGPGAQCLQRERVMGGED